MNRHKHVITAIVLAAATITAFGQSRNTRRTLGPSGPMPIEPVVTAPAKAPPVVQAPIVVDALPVPAPTPKVEVPVEVLAAKPQVVTPAAKVALAAEVPKALDVAKEQPATADAAPKAPVAPAKIFSPAKSDAPTPEALPIATQPDRPVASIAVTTPAVEPETPYAKEVARLQAVAAAPIPLRNVALSTVIRAIAMHSSMNYIAPNEEEFAEVVTLRYTGSPWQLLSILKRRHNFEMSFEDGIWSFYRTNPAELVSRSYQLRYNNNVSVKSSGGGGAALAQSNSSSGTGGQSQQAQTGARGNIFESSGDQIVKDLKALLGIPITGLDASIADGIVVGEVSPIAGASKAQSPGKIEAPKSDVIYLPDSNSLFIIATRQQHQYVEEFLKVSDRPQPLIRIDAQLVETNRDPRSFIGIDPSGYARPTISLKDATGGATTGTGTGSTSSATGSGSSNLSSSTFDLGKLSTLRAPNAAVLSASDISFQLNLLKQDSSSRVTNQPNLVTTNNREVSIESVIEEPYASSQTNNAFNGSAGTNGQTTTQLDRIKIGTVINVLPQIMHGENGQRLVYLNLEMTVSGKVGDKLVFGQLVPITSSRSYRYSIAVPDGYTLAIGGLDETSISQAENKVPLAGDIPVVGYLFKSKAQTNTRRNLIAYITPTILDMPGADATKSAYRPIPVDTGAVGKARR